MSQYWVKGDCSVNTDNWHISVTAKLMLTSSHGEAVNCYNYYKHTSSNIALVLADRISGKEWNTLSHNKQHKTFLLPSRMAHFENCDEGFTHLLFK